MSVKTRHIRHIAEFDGLRGVLSFWVAISHIFCWCGFATFPFITPDIFRRFWNEFVFASGAVDVFIILSGFVISYLLYSRTQTYNQFMTGRFFRIYPVYIFCLSAGVFTIFADPYILNHAIWRNAAYFQMEKFHLDHELFNPKANLLAHLTLLFGIIPQRLLPDATYAFLPPAWSITLEWQYYLIAPFIVSGIRSIAGIFTVGLIGCGALFYEHHWTGSFLLNNLSLFLVGIGCFQLYVNFEKWKHYKHTVYTLLAVWAAIMTISWHWVALTIWTLVFGSLVVAETDMNFIARLLRFLKKILSHPALQFAGKISYPLYLIHWPMIIFLLYALLHWFPGISAKCALLILLGGGLPIILFAAFLLHRYVESPFMQYGKKFQ